ncbi:hypothetical protein [Pseudovibrio sp. SCP19]|uniref:hypothetical protein n=1 Tax=Pseudovibrio sp. SCP19 TaxID=3141374 RepID=UPI00333BE49C
MSKIVSILRGSLLRPVKLVDVFVVAMAAISSIGLYWESSLYSWDLMVTGKASFFYFAFQMLLPLLGFVSLSSWTFCPLLGTQGNWSFFLSIVGVIFIASTSAAFFSLFYLVIDQYSTTPFFMIEGGVLHWVALAIMGGGIILLELAKFWWATLPITLGVHFVAQLLRQREGR